MDGMEIINKIYQSSQKYAFLREKCIFLSKSLFDRIYTGVSFDSGLKTKLLGMPVYINDALKDDEYIIGVMEVVDE